MADINPQLQALVSTPQFVLQLITDESTSVQTRQAHLPYGYPDASKGRLQRGRCSDAALRRRHRRWHFRPDRGAPVADRRQESHGHLTNAVFWKHQELHRERRERVDRNVDDGEMDFREISPSDKDAIFLRSLLYDLRKYFTPRVECEVLEKKPFTRDPPANYKRAILMADVPLEDMRNDFIVGDDEDDDDDEAQPPMEMEADAETADDDADAAAPTPRTPRRRGRRGRRGGASSARAGQPQTRQGSPGSLRHRRVHDHAHRAAPGQLQRARTRWSRISRASP